MRAARNVSIFFILTSLISGSAIFATPFFSHAASEPIVYTKSVSSVNYSSATFRGVVHPKNLSTTAWFEYGTTPALGTSVSSQEIGSGSAYVDYSIPVFNLQPRTTYYYRAAAQNTQGTSYGDILSFATGLAPASRPTVSTNSPTAIGEHGATLQATVNPNGRETSVWFEWGTRPSLQDATPIGFHNFGNGISSMSYSSLLDRLNAGVVYYYRAVAENSYGETKGATISFTTPGSPGQIPPVGPPPPAVSSAGSPTLTGTPAVFTLPASFISSSGALLKGSVNPRGEFTSAWFEWGSSLAAFGRSSSPQPIGNGNNFLEYSFAASGFAPRTTYYFQAVARNLQRVERGVVLSFTTPGVVGEVPPSPPVSRVTPVRPSAPKPPLPVVSAPVGSVGIVLIPSVEPAEPHAGGELEFTVVYRNEGDGTARDAVLAVVLPDGVEYIKAHLPPRAQSGKNIEFFIGNLSPHDQGTVTVRVRINESVKKGSILLFQAIMQYKNENGDSMSSNVFLAVKVDGNGRFLAALFGSFAAWGFWLLFILLLIVLLLTFYLLFIRRKRENENGNGQKKKEDSITSMRL